jgi:hypothetical protein
VTPALALAARRGFSAPQKRPSALRRSGRAHSGHGR